MGPKFTNKTEKTKATPSSNHTKRPGNFSTHARKGNIIEIFGLYDYVAIFRWRDILQGMIDFDKTESSSLYMSYFCAQSVHIRRSETSKYTSLKSFVVMMQRRLTYRSHFFTRSILLFPWESFLTFSDSLDSCIYRNAQNIRLSSDSHWKIILLILIGVEGL